LESSVIATDGSAGFWEMFGWLCAVAVGIGIAGEIVVIVSEHWEDLQDWRRGIIRPPDRPPAWRFWFDIVATLVVLGGVFGEAGATGEVASINSQLRSKTSELRAKSDQLLALVTQQAGEAKDSALIAEASAKAAGIAADKALDTSNTANDAAGKAQEKVEAVGKQADDLLQKYREAESKREELEKSLWPREFPLVTSPKGNNFDSLKPFTPINVVIEFLPDAEAARAASHIVGLAHAAGWNVVDVEPNPKVIAGFFDGVVVHTPLAVPWDNPRDTAEGERLEGAGNAIVGFLTSYKWVARRSPVKLHEFGVNTIKISIGFKPSPYFQDPEIKKIMEEIEHRKH
jgi:hypothetical protein